MHGLLHRHTPTAQDIQEADDPADILTSDDGDDVLEEEPSPAADETPDASPLKR